MINNLLFRSTRFCSSVAAVNNLTYPTKEFLNQFPKHRISNLIAEVDVIYKFADYVPSHLSDDNWQKLMDATSVVEREEFLFQLCNNEWAIKKNDEKLSEVKNKQKEIFNLNKQLFDNGSIIYGRTFYRLLGDEYFHASKFVERISLIYGSRCCQNYFLNEFLPKILIDCRHLYQLHVKHLNVSVSRIQALHDYNMLSDYPLPISLVNFFSSEAVGHAIKKHFHFLFGPQSVVDKCETDIPAEVIRSSLTSKLDGFLDSEEGEDEIDNEKENIYKYQPNEFIPEITTKSILEVCKREGINKEEIAYISNSASQYLPDDAEIIRKKFKAFVFSPLEDKFNPRQRPSSFAPNEQIQVYRLPLEKYLGFRPPTFQSPHFSIELIKALYSGRTEDWNWAINNRTPALRIQNLSSIPSPWSDNETTFTKIKEKREEKLTLIKETLQKQKELINNLKLNKNIINLKQQNKFITQAMTKQRFGNRKYSREERNLRRKEIEKMV